MNKFVLFAKMQKLAKLSAQVWALSREICDELEQRGIKEEEMYDGGGLDMAELESGNDVSVRLMERYFGKGWNN